MKNIFSVTHNYKLKKEKNGPGNTTIIPTAIKVNGTVYRVTWGSIANSFTTKIDYV